MEKKRFFEILYMVLIVSLILFMIFIFLFLRSSATSCLSNPVRYFEEKNKGASCFCVNGINRYDFGEKEKSINIKGS